MALYGDSRDISLFRHFNRELLNNIIEQKCGYYKLVLDRTKASIYGDGAEKTYNNPVLINCLVVREDQQNRIDDFGPDVRRTMSFRFLRDDLAGLSISTEQLTDAAGFTYNIVPEVGDIILWNNDYFEVDNVIENQLILGKYPEYSYSSDTDDFGSSLSIICETHYTRPEKIGISPQIL